SIIRLLHAAPHGSLATQSRDFPGYPYLSVLPFVLDEHHFPVFLISGLAEHTRNLEADARAAMLVTGTVETDVQAAPRLTILGEIRPFEPQADLIQRALRYHPTAARLLQLADFHFARMRPERLRYIAGFGQMGWLDGAALGALPVLEPGAEVGLLAALSRRLPDAISLLGIDRWGIDLRSGTTRHRLPFTSPPLPDPALEPAVLSAVATLYAAGEPHLGH
ncbi:MAG: pyridoxamine 5'-phosphate oxidase, partial [Gammaproteobacteria bacterium]|nr:pyridoxamine 5'-phosphate oxidase [Gammaproteobacteria bacterium]